jgi:hypothetical protein
MGLINKAKTSEKYLKPNSTLLYQMQRTELARDARKIWNKTATVKDGGDGHCTFPKHSNLQT